ncbi:ThiJ/PfpI family protein [Bacillus sp. JCM 19046]|uniref:Intracellular protease/amidase n=1 Tax=Shouchella xiaoxiensis TaxID=766895 RepID=A0ABS2T0A3_9BACI|nr:type 1 glutamine amidotransferase domain-containing protein [Shouchella xiaoxiensis]MBM7841208.1 putative intracellular protease/amidase [Shouchella xiaoxiensis]GAF17493.1 ThiJ/PfpI family protein [Bacillus sp. JCM 19046]
MSQKHILMVVTNGATMNNDHLAGIWLSEFTEPYEEFINAGYQVTVASPKGGESPIDQASLDDGAIPEQWHEMAELLKHTIPLAELKSVDYDGIFMPGGHGAMFDLADNEQLQQLLRDFYVADKSIGSVCHGPAALTGVLLENGEYLVSNRKLTSFTNTEEESVELVNQMPFLLETRLRKEGAIFLAKDDWQENVYTDGKLVTGQNPQSSIETAKQFLKTV